MAALTGAWPAAAGRQWPVAALRQQQQTPQLWRAVSRALSSWAATTTTPTTTSARSIGQPSCHRPSLGRTAWVSWPMNRQQQGRGRREHLTGANRLPPGTGSGRQFYSSSSSSSSSSTPKKPPSTMKEEVQSSIIYAPPPPPPPPPASSSSPPGEAAKTGADAPAASGPTEPDSDAKARADDYADRAGDSSAPPKSSSSSFLPSDAESRRSRLSARFSRFMDNFQSRVLVASQALNDLTGYSAIDQIKARNAQLETDLAAAQADLRAARRAYLADNARRAATQREVTTLLARKDSWSPADLERFTALYRRDHELEAAAGQAGDRLQEAEETEARLSAALTAGILKRYHEEQVWSDRIRRQSTWGTWGLMAVNAVLFLVLQVFAEPWRRRRLMRGIAEAESGVLEDVRQELADVRAALAAATAATAASTAARPAETDAAGVMHAPTTTTTTVPPPPEKNALVPAAVPWSWEAVCAFGADPSRWKAWALDLYSDRLVPLRVRDVSLLALQSAAAGAAFAGGLVFALRRP